MRINIYYPNPSRVGPYTVRATADTPHVPRVGERVDPGDGREREVESVLYRFTPSKIHSQVANIVVNLK